MSPTDQTDAAVPASSIASAEAPRPYETRNFCTLVVYHIVMRTGWIFKTESSIMPAVIDSLAGSGWIRGWLPLLNRFGQSVPPLLMARRIKLLRKKKRAFVLTTSSMALLFAGMASLWLIPGLTQSRYAAAVYLSLYTLFFMAIGINQLAYNTIQGKLIQPTHRGRLLMLADTLGAGSAIFCALLLLPRWLRSDGADFASIFGFSALLFSFSTITAALLKEQPDDYHAPPQSMLAPFAGAWQLLRKDANLRRLGMVAALFSTSLVLFPHYQSLASKELKLDSTYLLWWIVAQNIGTAIFSVLTGPLADRFGNRLSLRILTLAICAAPQLALWMTAYPPADGRWFGLVFLLVGMTPVAQKTFNNFALEMAPREEHPRYLSTLNLCLAAPILLSPLFGGAIDWLGFPLVFHGVTLVLLAGGLLSTTLIEPRLSLGERKPLPIADIEDSL